MTRVHRVPTLAGVRSVVASIVEHPANVGHRPTVLARAFLAQARWRLSGAPTIVPFGEHSRIEARLDAGSSKRALYARLPDHREMRAWQRILEPGSLFVDVGANAGLYTVLGCESGADVIAVEPLSDAVRQLRRNLALNGFEAQIVEAVLGAEVGTARIGGPDSQRAHVGHDGDEVPMTTIDELVGERFVAGIKIDVEGAELHVLEGARRLLAEQRAAVIQLEWNDRARVNYGADRDGVAKLLWANGYELYRPDETGALRSTSAAEGSDVFAMPASTMPDASRLTPS